MEARLNSEGNLDETGRAPYEIPADVQANPEDYSPPIDDIALLLKEQTELLHRLVDASEAQRATPRQSMIDLTTNPTSTTVAWRVQEIVLTSTAAATITLIVGSSVFKTFAFAAADTKRLPLIVMFGRGVDISIATTGGAGTASGYFIAYPE